MPAPRNTISLTSAAWLSAPETRVVLRALTAAGFEARVVGGAVRNALIGRPVADIDIATTAKPEQTIEAVQKAGLKAIPTGLQHGTITVVANHIPFEVTTLRTDVETDGRHARVAFTADWAADASRRDFTINALYCDADGTIYDPIGGLADIDPPRMRFIGIATDRIREDYLRILRFFRFTAAYTDGLLDGDGLAACHAERAGLAHVSAERIQAEFLKLLVAKHAEPVLTVMAAQGFLRLLLDTPCNVPSFARLTAIEAALGRAPDAIVRLAALTPATTASATHLAKKLRLSNADKTGLTHASTAAVTCHRPGDEQRSRLALYSDGADAFQPSVMVAWARSGRPHDDVDWTALYRLADRWTPPEFPLIGGDIVAAGVPPGPLIGELLNELESWWIGQDFPPDRAAVLAELTRRLAINRPDAKPASGRTIK